jgi:hypothetical protein
MGNAGGDPPPKVAQASQIAGQLGRSGFVFRVKYKKGRNNDGKGLPGNSLQET